MTTLLNFPDSVRPSRMRWGQIEAGATITGPTGLAQRQSYTGIQWTFSAQFPPANNANDVAVVRTFLQRIKSPSVWFQAPDYSYARRSAVSGTPLIKGASQTGSTLALDGFGNGVTGAVKLGDRIGLTTGQVVTAAADANSNGSGEVTVTIIEPLRASPADNSAVYITTPLVVFRALGMDAQWDVDLALTYGFVLDAIEDITSGVPAVAYGSWP